MTNTRTNTTTAPTRVIAIDRKITNFATAVIEGGRTPLIFDGKASVSRLRWATKTIAKLKTRFDTLVQQYQAKVDTYSQKGTIRSCPSLK